MKTIKVGGWTGWGSGAKRNGGDPPHRIITYIKPQITDLLIMYL
jgi:hypothetical protein